MTLFTAAARFLVTKGPATAGRSCRTLRTVSASVTPASLLSRSAPPRAVATVAETSASSRRTMSTMDTMETGTKTYMSLYPEGSTDGGLRLGNIVPDFAMETTQGNFDSFHEWKKGACLACLVWRRDGHAACGTFGR